MDEEETSVDAAPMPSTNSVEKCILGKLFQQGPDVGKKLEATGCDEMRDQTKKAHAGCDAFEMR